MDNKLTKYQKLSLLKNISKMVLRGILDVMKSFLM